jgi:hypothetical protein
MQAEQLKFFAAACKIRALGSLAQLVEQRTFNPLVAGSNPARPTKIQKKTPTGSCGWRFFSPPACPARITDITSSYISCTQEIRFTNVAYRKSKLSLYLRLL